MDKPHWLTGKANYVRKAPAGDGSHTCHWPGCRAVVKPALWGCGKHWWMLPKHLRLRIWGAYRPGQEVDKQPSEKYLLVAQDVQDWIRKYKRC